MTEAPNPVPPGPGAIEAPRLAAVVFTDVVGYSALMQRDEALTLQRVAADFAAMRALSTECNGEVLNTMGDGMMLCFPSAQQAVGFALAMQQAFGGRGEGLRHRVGIHLGDVYRLEGGQIAGDGVNLAARLEGRAPIGGICMSQTVYDTVKGKIALAATFAGPQAFKNIAQPVPVWMVAAPGETVHLAPAETARPGRRRVIGLGAAGLAAAVAGVVGLRWRLGGDGADLQAKSIAVLPFVNLGEDKETSYFADGVHEDLLTQLALVGQLKVVSRNSVLEYRNTSKKSPQIGAELKVGSLVAGSVRRAGSVVRVTAQLLDASADKHIWAANYDRDLKDVFRVQSDLASEIARALDVSLTAAEQKRLATVPTRNGDAYDLYLRHQQLVRQDAGTYRAIPAVKQRIELLQRAVTLDPDFALAWARLAGEYARARSTGMVDRAEGMDRARQSLDRARTLAPDDLQLAIETATVQVHGLDDRQGAIRSYEAVLTKAPYNVEALLGLGEALNHLGRDKEAVPVLERGLLVDARHRQLITRLAGTLGRYRQYPRVLELRRQLVDLRPDSVDLRAAVANWEFWRTGTWDSYDAWRPTLPKGAELQSARVRNIDTDRAIARGDFTEVHRLIEVDSDDWRRDMSTSETSGGLLALHALAWNAAGDRARALQVASGAVTVLDREVRKKPDDDSSWDSLAQALALLGKRQAAMDAFDKSVSTVTREGDEYFMELRRRRVVLVRTLLGDLDAGLAMLRRQARSPGFLIHECRVMLPLAPLWKHPEFLALVGDPASNAALPLDAPLRTA